ELQLRCASDSYNFDLVGQFTADDQNQVSGRWTERSRSTGGTAVGNAQSDRRQLHIGSTGLAAAPLTLTRKRRPRRGNRPHGDAQPATKRGYRLAWCRADRQSFYYAEPELIRPARRGWAIIAPASTR